MSGQAPAEVRKIADQVERKKLPPPSRAQAVVMIRQMADMADEIERLRKIEAAACAVTSSPLWTGEDFDELLWALDAALKEG